MSSFHHVRSDDVYADDPKLIGTYVSQEDAAAAVERLRDQPGFRDHPGGWDIQRWRLSEDHWKEGFITPPDADLISFRYEPEDEGHGKLMASAEVGDFTGIGEAWFTTETLRSFAEACKVCPLQAKNPPSLAGGYWDDGGNILEEAHLSIVLEPYNVGRSIRAIVQLATNSYTESERDVASSANIRFLLTYADLEAFASHFLLLISGRETSVALRSSL